LTGYGQHSVLRQGKGIVVNDFHRGYQQDYGEVEAVGKEAKEMLGRTPATIVAIKPMKDGSSPTSKSPRRC